jgi:hypothetical protein
LGFSNLERWVDESVPFVGSSFLKINGKKIFFGKGIGRSRTFKFNVVSSIVYTRHFLKKLEKTAMFSFPLLVCVCGLGDCNSIEIMVKKGKSFKVRFFEILAATPKSLSKELSISENELIKGLVLFERKIFETAKKKKMLNELNRLVDKQEACLASSNAKSWGYFDN